jgi:hypothetical protein
MSEGKNNKKGMEQYSANIEPIVKARNSLPENVKVKELNIQPTIQNRNKRKQVNDSFNFQPIAQARNKDSDANKSDEKE